MAQVTGSGLKQKRGDDDGCSEAGGGGGGDLNRGAGSRSFTAEQLRKEERRLMARKKLEEDRRRLEAELKEKDPLAVIPEVAMEVLAKMFDRPEDKVNLSKVSPAAAKPLEKTKAKWFFHKIFSLPDLLQFLSKTEIIAIRRVCRDWREAVDNYVKAVTARNSITLPPLLDHPKRQYEIIERAAALTPALNDNIQRLQEMVRRADLEPPHPINPFISGRANFHWFDLAGNQLGQEGAYWRNVLTLLDRYGREVHSLRFSYRSRQLTTLEILEVLRECLRRMPFLTELSGWVLSVSRRQTENLSQYQEMPWLAKLTRLSCQIERPVGVEHRIFSHYFDQLVSLDAGSIGSFLKRYNPQLHSTFSSLKYLRLSEGSDEFLFKLMMITGPLQQVSIKLGQKVPLCLSVFLHIMSPFGGTLSALEIIQSFSCAEFDMKEQNNDHSLMQVPLPIWKKLEAYGLLEPESFNLPHLKILVIPFSDCGYGSYDPLLKLKGSPIQQLEIIVVPCYSWNYMDKPYQRRGGDELEVYGFERRMYTFNIWRLMPELQNLSFIKAPYYRY